MMMRLDRNINPDGRGKYALLNLRKLCSPIGEVRAALVCKAHIPNEAIETGGEPKEQFFVIKYKDKFAPPALRAYAKAVREHVEMLRNRHFPKQTAQTQQEAIELEEFAQEIEREAELAESVKNAGIPD